MTNLNPPIAFDPWQHIAGYRDLSESRDQAASRIRWAHTQAAILTDRLTSPEVGTVEPLPHDLRVAARTLPPTVAAWDWHAPIVAVTVDFAPFTDRMKPTGNIIWIDPSTDRSLADTVSRMHRIVNGFLIWEWT